MEYTQIIYQPGPIARVIMNRPRYHNAQSSTMLEEMDHAFMQAAADDEVRVIIMSGNGKHFSAGHDIGTPEMIAERETRLRNRQAAIKYQKEHYVDMSLRWRGIPKPTIAMVHGYCIFGGWLIASTMDLVFASEDAMFLPSNLQFFTVPWELGVKKAKEVLFESRFLTAKEAQEYGFVNRVFPREKLEEETLAYARRVADTDPLRLATSKFLCNQAQDLMGYTNAAISGFQTYSIGILDSTPEQIEAMKHGKRRLDAVDLALKHSGAPEADRGR